MALRFGQEALSATSWTYLGLTSGVAVAPTSVDPTTSTTLGKIGIGHSGNSGNWQIISNPVGASVVLNDLGSSVPVNTTDLIEATFFAPPNDTEVTWRVQNLSTGYATSGTISNAALPASTVFMTMHAYTTNGGTAAANNLGIVRMYLETDY